MQLLKRLKLWCIRKHFIVPEGFVCFNGEPYKVRDPHTEDEWDEQAAWLGVISGKVLKAQTELADSILQELMLDENKE
jgi:hypothetical protein